MNKHLGASLLVLALAACATQPTTQNQQVADDVAATRVLETYLDAVFEQYLDRHPTAATQIGEQRGRDRWDEISDEADLADLEEAKAKLIKLATINPARLTDSGRVSYAVAREQAQATVRAYEFRYQKYAATHQSGPHIDAPSLLFAMQLIDSREGADAYVSRLEKLGRYLGQEAGALAVRASKGMVPPHFMFARMEAQSREMLRGVPFDKGPKDSPLYGDFKTKLEKFEMPQADRDALLARARKALVEQVGPGYRAFLATVQRIAPQAKRDHGASALPDGAAYYKEALRGWTTLAEPDANVIHATGLSEVKRLQGEMHALLRTMGEKDDLPAYFKKLRTDPKFYYPNDETGRAAFLRDSNNYLAQVERKIPDWFGVQPKAKVEIRRIEPFREKNAPDAHYLLPAQDGSRPGIFYFNLRDMKARPKWDNENTVYHEAVPGHHFQLSIAAERPDLPKFRRFYDAGAYSEGWALYVEELTKEMGLYTDPTSDFGRLGAEIWRAARLVVDTGMHAKGWTRKQATTWFAQTVPISPDTAASEIDRYLADPGQATSYKIGMIEIQRLRAKATAALGTKFNLKRFHDLVLTNGALPLPVLQSEIDRWIASGG
ncbi:DUF885 domain-containing protein [Roseiterribacter gracilis]|uniref:DUF885 domain-containing protein n=1 Tax=Roseiterribacter gracilis TaxID=2812848 RepID=A0A8S8XBQ2_9PROT|nr:hypothetical protein TMPK1_17190 [Rhodospirillales bacterium TMPK1]